MERASEKEERREKKTKEREGEKEWVREKDGRDARRGKEEEWRGGEGEGRGEKERARPYALLLPVEKRTFFEKHVRSERWRLSTGVKPVAKAFDPLSPPPSKLPPRLLIHSPPSPTVPAPPHTANAFQILFRHCSTNGAPRHEKLSSSSLRFSE